MPLRLQATLLTFKPLGKFWKLPPIQQRQIALDGTREKYNYNGFENLLQVKTDLFGQVFLLENQRGQSRVLK